LEQPQISIFGGIMKKKGLFVIVLFIFFIAGIYIGLFFEWNKNEYYDNDGLWPMLTAEGKEFMPNGGFVPNERIALKIAKIVWEPIYGLKHLIWHRYKYKIRLIDGNVWVIEGVSRWGGNGGGPFIKIDKNKGTILEVTHTF
jgi:hypothetical protein